MSRTAVIIEGEQISLPDGETVPSIMVKAAEQLKPKLFAQLYPRRYNDLGPYHSPKVLAAFLVDVISSSMKLPFEKLSVAHRFILPSMKELMKKRMPLMFIAPQLIEALKLTDFDEPINWKEMKLPYENGIFMLPKGALTHPEDGDALCIIYSRAWPGDYMPPVNGLPIFEVQKSAFTFLALCHESAMWYDGNLTDPPSPFMKLNNLFFGIGIDEHGQGPHLPTPTFLDHHLNKVDSIFLEKAAALLFGTLLVMNAKPSLSEPAKLQKRIAKAGTEPIEYWSPNVIGKYYELPRIIKGAQGTHASPRMHWRRGHFREHAVGPRHSLHKTIWLEPQLIGAEKKDKKK